MTKLKGIILFIFVFVCSDAYSQTEIKARLLELFEDAEQSYLIDDYQQLYKDYEEYRILFDSNRLKLGDDLDIFTARGFKMFANYCYIISSGNDNYINLAESYYLACLELLKKLNSDYEIITIHKEFAQLYYKKSQYTDAYYHLTKVFDFYDEHVNKYDIDSEEPEYFLVMSQLAICNARLATSADSEENASRLFAKAVSQIDDAINYFKKSYKSAYYEALRKKGKILILQAERLGYCNYTEARKWYEKYLNEQYQDIERRMLSMTEQQKSQYWLYVRHFMYDCCRLADNAPEMIYDLTLFSKGYLVNSRTQRTTWSSVKKELNDNECALEFVQYNGRNEQRRMGCLVLHKESRSPVFVDLFAVDSLLSCHITQLKTVGDAISSSKGDDKNMLYNNEQLAEAIWSPRLMAAIGNSQKIFFSPDGFLHLFAIEYIIPDKQKACYRLSSTRNIKRKRKQYRLGNAMICGGMNYYSYYKPTTTNNDSIAYRFLVNNNVSFCQLPGTKAEIDSIYAYRNNANDTILYGENATDDNFIKLLKYNYDIVHLSTHGFFLGNSDMLSDIKPFLFDKSMSYSGLVFSGASTNLSNKSFVVKMNDGILSAMELARLDFSKSELLVLSACQTGVGNLSEDGIYGVQRGLKQAGANALILSLWPVNDITSSLLMQFFYEELVSNKDNDIHTAFFTARERLMTEGHMIWRFDPETFTIREYKQTYSLPQYTNPFVLIDVF